MIDIGFDVCTRGTLDGFDLMKNAVLRSILRYNSEKQKFKGKEIL